MAELLPFLPGIALALGAVALGLCSPGPNILAVIGTAMAVGRQEAVALAAGIALGTGIWAVLAWAGLSALLTAYAGALTALKIVGGLYLLWLAVKAFRSAARTTSSLATAPLAPSSRLGYFRRGLAVQLTNPKAALAWLATMALGLSGGAPLIVGALIVTVGTAMSLVAHLGYATAFSTQTAVALYARARRGIETTLGAFYTFAAYRLLSDRS